MSSQESAARLFRRAKKGEECEDGWVCSWTGKDETGDLFFIPEAHPDRCICVPPGISIVFYSFCNKTEHTMTFYENDGCTGQSITADSGDCGNFPFPIKSARWNTHIT
jgi:hypothetical protein